MAKFINPRRILHWNRVRSPQAVTAVFIGTAGGAGLFPVAPGTVGTLIGLPIAYYTANWDFTARIFLWSAISLIGTWACKEFDRLMGSQDNQNLVIDEVAGMGITAWTLGASSGNWKAWLAAFLIFRFFDVVKIPPVRQIDRWSKKGSAWLGGFGVMADDLAAGVQGLLTILILQKLQVF